MKKFFVTIGLILGLTTGVFATSYKNVVITDLAASVIKSLKLSNFTKAYVKVDDINYKTYVLHYDNISTEFENLNNSEIADISSSKVKDGIKAGTYIQVNSTSKVKKNNGEYVFNDGICNSFAKSLAPNYPNHVKSSNFTYQRIRPNQNIKYGTIIASNAKTGFTGHTAVLLYVGNKSLWVMDQNAFKKVESGGGLVEMHEIKFGKECSRNKPDCYYDNFNAYNYHILRYK